MNRTSFRAALVAAMVLLLIACTDAQAQTDAATADAGVANTEGAAPAAAQPAPTTSGSEDGSASADQGAVEATTEQGGAQPAASEEAAPAQSAPSDGGTPSGSSSASGAPATASAPPAAPAESSQTGLADSAAQTIGRSTSTASGEPSGPASAPGPVAPGDASGSAPGRAAPVTDAAPALGGKADPGPVGALGGRPSPVGAGGTRLEQLLPGLERDLRTIQALVEHLRQRLDAGAPPPKSLLATLRSRLRRIAPVLLAFGLEAPGHLNPRLRALLARIEARLRGAGPYASGLVAALHRSGVRGAELRLFLHALASVRPLAVAPAAYPAPAPDAYAAHTQLFSPTTATERHSAGAPSAQRAAPQHGGASRGRSSREAAPLSAAPGSASAGPGGALSGAGPAALVLLTGLALASLLARLDLPSARPYAVAFAAPVERPG